MGYRDPKTARLVLEPGDAETVLRYVEAAFGSMRMPDTAPAKRATQKRNGKKNRTSNHRS